MAAVAKRIIEQKMFSIIQPPTRNKSVTGVHYRLSIIRPAPGRYVNVGTEDGLCSSFCLLRLASCSFGRSNCALQPVSTVRTTNQIADLNRFILSSLCVWFCHCAPYLMILSALASTFGGIVRPICFAVFRLITNSNFVGCSTGMSAGFVPLRILSTIAAVRL